MTESPQERDARLFKEVIAVLEDAARKQWAEIQIYSIEYDDGYDFKAVFPEYERKA